jgi:WD40 repeat protein
MTLDQRIAAATQSAESMVAELDIPAIEQRRPLRYRIVVGLTVVVLIVTTALAVGLSLRRTATPAVTQPDGGRPSNGVILVSPDPRNDRVLGGEVPIAFNPDGSEPEGFEIGDLGNVSDFAWAPDGLRLAVVNESGLSILDVETGSTQLLDESCRTAATPAGRPAGYCEVSWSPDGRTIATATRRGLHLVNSRSGATTLLIDFPSSGPVFSPDGSSVAFTSSNAGQLYTIRRDGTGTQELGESGSEWWTSPVWVPGIDRVLFMAVRDTSSDDFPSEVVLMSIDPHVEGAEAIDLAVLGQCFCLGLVPAMVLAPDGAMVLGFAPIDSGSFGLFTMNFDGSDLRPLDTGTREVAGPNLAWQPVP